MKKIILTIVISLFAFKAFAKEQKDFFFKPAISIEYSAPDISGNGVNGNFKTSQGFFEQMKDFQNLALGFNFRVHKYLGFNTNWSKTEMDNAVLSGVGALSRKAVLQVENYNFSTLFYIPTIKDSKKTVLELFAELGASDIRTKLSYIDTIGNPFSGKSHQTKLFYGAGFQMNLTDKDSLRFSFQKYDGKLSLVDSNFTTVRIGYLRTF